ncbi:MAG: DNA-directed RNA polymerase subunit D [Candidatus Aenigmarchaeota archaeon]|nr:DNA-directed RNA polymerase subunit D [Candidatus Aenigmarchaeota archaeon]
MNMQIQKISKSDREIKFSIEGTNAQFVNALRRIAITEVPILAVDHVNFFVNDSAMYDEIIAHRLALLPLSFEQKTFVLPEDCKCNGEGCTNCQIILSIDKKGPCIVYAKDIKSEDKEAASTLYPETPIVELLENQRLKLTAVAKLGLGKTHAKHSAAKAFFRLYPSVKLSDELKNPEDCIKICPKHALSIEGKKASVNEDCDLCGECVKTSLPKDVLTVSGTEGKYIFILESISGLSAEDIMLQANDILKKKLKDFGKQVKSLK